MNAEKPDQNCNPCSSVFIRVAFRLRFNNRRPAFERQREAEHGAAARPILGPDASAMRFHDPATDGQPQTDPAGPAGRLDAIKLFEDALLLARRQARPPISDEELSRIEDLTNAKVLENVPVTTRLMEVDDAIASGARLSGGP